MGAYTLYKTALHRIGYGIFATQKCSNPSPITLFGAT